jgi:uncharacterized membrane protein
VTTSGAETFRTRRSRSITSPPEEVFTFVVRIRDRVPRYAAGTIVGKLFGRQLERGIVNAIERLARELK